MQVACRPGPGALAPACTSCRARSGLAAIVSRRVQQCTVALWGGRRLPRLAARGRRPSVAASLNGPAPNELLPSSLDSGSSSSSGGPPFAARRRLPWVQQLAAAVALATAGLLASCARPASAAAAGAGPGSQRQQQEQQPTAAAAADAGTAAAHVQRQQQLGRRWSDTGILLAAGREQKMRPDELGSETLSALQKAVDDETMLKQMKRTLRPSRGGKPVKDPARSTVPSPADIPSDKELEKVGLQTAWRPDKLREMTYTQFWELVRERQVARVRYTDDRRSVVVTTRTTAPGGARTEKVGLPYDPDLFDHMVSHGVYIESPDPNPAAPLLHALARLVFPIFFSFLLVKVAFRFGRKKQRDKIFGGANLQQASSQDQVVTFEDIAGIDQVKEEIQEVVTFLKDPGRFLKLGARSPAGVLLVGPPGTGKTLLAKAIAGEAGVPFFSIAGTEFMEMFVGVGASRVRDVFSQARAQAPCILFIDEFDGLGKARSYGGVGSDESVHTINQLLTEMDGFEDNTGVVVMAATNRPAALDQALTRPGRFDRVVHLPLPNVDGRIEILKIHARDKKMDPGIDFTRVARATAGFTGAQLMNLMNQSAMVAVRQARACISEAEVFEALEKIHRDRVGEDNANINYDSDNIPAYMLRTIALYEASRVLVGYITPGFDEVQRVSICPGGLATGYTYFLPQEEMLESAIVTRAYLESRMVVAMAGRCGEKLLLGEAHVSTAGASDLEQANNIAREMVYRCGFSRRLGPVALMDDEEVYINRSATRRVANVSTETAKLAYQDIQELMDGAEAKAYYGLARNYKQLELLTNELLRRRSLSGPEVAEILEGAGVRKFEDPYVDGFGWDPSDGQLLWPGRAPAPQAPGEKPELEPELVPAGASGSSTSNGANGASAAAGVPDWYSPRNPYYVRGDVASLLSEGGLN